MPSPEAEHLLKRIRDRRRSLKSFIDNLEPAGTRLTNVNIIFGAIATLLTATPAVGGKSLVAAIGITDLNSLSWRILFATAALFSLFSTIAAQLYKSQDIASRLLKAQVCDVKLEGLGTLLETGQIDLKEAATQYTQYIAEAPFITGSRFLKSSSAVDWVRAEINEPKPNQVIGSTIACSGWVEGVGPECHLWLAVEADGYIWPKEREFFAEDDGSWKDTIYEEGTTATFSLSLFAADNQANKRIRAWLDKGDRTGNYDQMRRLPGTRRIAKIDGLRAQMFPERKY